MTPARVAVGGTAAGEAATLYALEAASLDTVTRRFATVAEARRFVEEMVLDDWFATTWPEVDVPEVGRRGRGATWSLAVEHAVHGDRVLLAELTASAALHEVAHLCAGGGAGHGTAFVAAELRLVRRWMGFHAYGALRSALLADGRWGSELP